MYDFSRYWDLFWHNKMFHKGENPKILISNIDTIRFESYDNERIINSKENIDSIFSNNYLPVHESKLLSENRLCTIQELKDIKRKSGDRPYVMHPLSVEYLLSLRKANFKVRFVGMNHDNLEELRGEKTQFSIDDLANNYIGTQKRIDSAFIDKPELKKLFSPKSKLELSLMMHKVTRLETDSDYYKSIDRLFDKNITYNTEGLEGAFFEYLKDLVISNNLVIDKTALITNLNSRNAVKPYIKLLLEENKQYLTVKKRDIHRIISGSALVKLADRISNTIDDYETKKFSSHLKDTMKNLYLIDGLTNYLKNNNHTKKFITLNDYNNLLHFRNMLIHVTRDTLKNKIKSIVHNNIDNKVFRYTKEHADEERDIYRKMNGFNHVDKLETGGALNLYEGNIIRLWNRVMKGDKVYETKIDINPGEQYIALTSLNEIIKNYRKDNNFLLPGFEYVK